MALRGYFDPSGKKIASKGLADTTNQQLVHKSIQRGHEQLAGNLGAAHEIKARSYPPGSRSHEFFSASSQHLYNQADLHFWAQKKNVGMKAENIHVRGRTANNYGGKYN